MAHDPSHFSPVFQIDVSAEPATADPIHHGDTNIAVIALLRQLIGMQERQNQLVEQLLNHTTQAQKQRSSELQQWKEANPRLARACRQSAEVLSKVQSQFIESLTEEIQDNEEALVDGDFILNEFVDRYGPRMAHLNGVLQVLAQLGNGVPAAG